MQKSIDLMFDDTRVITQKHIDQMKSACADWPVFPEAGTHVPLSGPALDDWIRASPGLLYPLVAMGFFRNQSS